jgi:hypothetical protein
LQKIASSGGKLDAIAGTQSTGRGSSFPI